MRQEVACACIQQQWNESPHVSSTAAAFGVSSGRSACTGSLQRSLLLRLARVVALRFSQPSSLPSPFHHYLRCELLCDRPDRRSNGAGTLDEEAAAPTLKLFLAADCCCDPLVVCCRSRNRNTDWHAIIVEPLLVVSRSWLRGACWQVWGV